MHAHVSVAAWLLLGFGIALSAAQGAEPASGLKEEKVETGGQGEPIIWCEFGKGQPAEAVRVGQEVDGKITYGEGAPESFWGVRRPGWTPRVLHAYGKPPDLTLDPGIGDTCDFYLGLRAVTPMMTLAIRLSSEKEFTTITAPAATPTYHFDWEFHWKWRVPMAGEKIVVRSLGQPIYLQYLRFVPFRREQAALRVPEAHLTILREKGRHFAFPGAAQLANGDLVVVAREGDAHVCPRGRIVMARSTDLGKTWAPREVISETPSDERDPAAICLKDGTLVVSFNTWDSWREDTGLRAKYATETAQMEKDGWGKYTGSFLILSTDGGKTWSERRKAPVFSPHGPAEGPDGALYWVGLESREDTSVVAIHRTADLGQTWTRHSEVSYSRPYGPSMSWEFWDEPAILFLPDGGAVCTIRVDVDGHVRQSYSRDGGKTWSWPKKLPVWGYPQHACRLPDGRLLLAYGYRREPFGIRACLSGDGGRTWDLAREVVFRHDGGHGDLGYPYSIVLKDGRVFTVYYHNQQGGDCYIEGAVYRP